jgi:myb proto-oncogene protein
MAAIKIDGSAKKVEINKGAWTAEEDQKLSQYIEIHGARRWKTIALAAGSLPCTYLKIKPIYIYIYIYIYI